MKHIGPAENAEAVVEAVAVGGEGVGQIYVPALIYFHENDICGRAERTRVHHRYRDLPGGDGLDEHLVANSALAFVGIGHGPGIDQLVEICFGVEEQFFSKRDFLISAEADCGQDGRQHF